MTSDNKLVVGVHRLVKVESAVDLLERIVENTHESSMDRTAMAIALSVSVGGVFEAVKVDVGDLPGVEVSGRVGLALSSSEHQDQLLSLVVSSQVSVGSLMLVDSVKAVQQLGLRELLVGTQDVVADKWRLDLRVGLVVFTHSNTVGDGAVLPVVLHLVHNVKGSSGHGSIGLLGSKRVQQRGWKQSNGRGCDQANKRSNGG